MHALHSLGSGAGVSRRTFRLVEPGLQLRLALAIIVITLAFGALAVGNSWMAYRDLLDVALTTAPVLIGGEIADQTERYVRVTSIIAVAYALTVVAISMIFVRRLIGPVVALERHARALKGGDYSSRVGVRGSDRVHAGLAAQLNDLAKRLEQSDATKGRDAAFLV